MAIPPESASLPCGAIRRGHGLFASCLLVLVLLSGCADEKPPLKTPCHLMALQPVAKITPETRPLEVALDDRWWNFGGTMERTEGRLLWEAPAEADEDSAFVAIDMELDTDAYNVLEVRMKSATSTRLKVAWLTDLEVIDTGLGLLPKISTPTFPDDAFHTYTFALEKERWFGSLRRLLLVPAVDGERAEIESVRFSYEKPEAPRRITIGEVTMEAGWGSQYPVKLRVPENAVLDAFTGMLPPAWTQAGKGTVEFQVFLKAEGKQPEVVFRRKASPAFAYEQQSWMPMRLDLSPWAGTEITLQLRVNHLLNHEGDYAFWGNPRVVAPADDEGGIPVILISCDTLRADHLSCYGYTRATSPELDAFAAEHAVIFDNAITPETYTLPAHMTMFTGLHPEHHRTTRYTDLPEAATTLPEMLQQAGYLTSGFTGHNWWLLPERGFSQGMDYYDVPMEVLRHIYRTSDAVARWLEQSPVHRQFIFFHNYDLHAKLGGTSRLPYDPWDLEYSGFAGKREKQHELCEAQEQGLLGNDLLETYNEGRYALNDQQHAYIEMLYDDCIRMVDESLGDFFRLLKSRGLFDRALIIVTSDHGESLNDHGFYGHAGVFEEISRVPLLVKFPDGKFAGTRFDGQVSLADILPTVQDVLSLPPPTETDGQSLLQVLEKKAAPKEYAFIRRGGQLAVRTQEWKLHWDEHRSPGAAALYHISEDPDEQTDVQGDQPEVFARLEKEMSGFFKGKPEGWHIRMNSPDPAWEGQLLITFDEPIATCYQVDEELNATQVELDNPLSISVELAEPWPHLLIIPSKAGARLKVNLRSEAAFSVLVGEESREPGLVFSEELDAAAAARATEAPPAAGPRLNLWYGKDLPEGDTALTPSDELVEQLRGLGYF